MHFLKRNFQFVLLIILSLTYFGCQDQTTEDTSKPEACFTYSPDVIYAGTSVEFSSNCSKLADMYDWEFGDGTYSADTNPVHIFASAGSYNVVLVVTDVNGNTATTTTTVTVEKSPVTEHGGVINADEVWEEGVHLITSSVYVSGATVTIMPGAVVKFKPGTSLFIGQSEQNSKLIADGTVDKPIVFTSNSDSPSPGDWDMIAFGDGALKTSSMKYCEISYGGGNSSSSSTIDISKTSLTIENCKITNSASAGINIEKDGFFESFTKNEIGSCASYAIHLFPNSISSLGANNTITTNMGIGVKSGTFNLASATWLKQTVPYVLEDDVYVGNETGAVLTIAPGVTIELKESTSLMVSYSGSSTGTLIAEGTEAEPITFTAAATSKAPGSWDRLGFYSGTSANTSLKYCIIEYGGGYSANEGMVVVDECAINMENCEIRNADNYGIRLGIHGLFDSFTNNYLHDNNSFAIKVFGNNAHTIGAGNIIDSSLGIEVNGDTYDRADETWLKQTCPYVINDMIYVESATTAKLTIEPGTTVKLMQDAGIRVGYRTNTYGVLVANGTADNKIIFTTSAASGSEAPGQWDGIFFHNGTGNGSILNYCDFSYGGGYSFQSGMVNCSLTPDGLPVVTNCDFSYSDAWGIYVSPLTHPQISDNTFSNNKLGDIKTN